MALAYVDRLGVTHHLRISRICPPLMRTYTSCMYLMPSNPYPQTWTVQFILPVVHCVADLMMSFRPS